MLTAKFGSHHRCRGAHDCTVLPDAGNAKRLSTSQPARQCEMSLSMPVAGAAAACCGAHSPPRTLSTSATCPTARPRRRRPRPAQHAMASVRIHEHAVGLTSARLKERILLSLKVSRSRQGARYCFPRWRRPLPVLSLDSCEASASACKLRAACPPGGTAAAPLADQYHCIKQLHEQL